MLLNNPNTKILKYLYAIFNFFKLSLNKKIWGMKIQINFVIKKNTRKENSIWLYNSHKNDPLLQWNLGINWKLFTLNDYFIKKIVIHKLISNEIALRAISICYTNQISMWIWKNQGCTSFFKFSRNFLRYYFSKILHYISFISHFSFLIEI